FLHGVALLSGIGTPSLTAQGGQRRPLQSFNRDRDIPVDVVTRLVDTIVNLSRSFSPVAREAIMALNEQVLIASENNASLNFDRKALQELLRSQRS
ncbi:hypothetical protein VQ045_21455, partial [Aurantimonas sp. E1-2-R+4]|uniref:hypothetical protein n=1 Tax=Aurantimonas sp. E1-2-R+4 TaxID=3113714 RepID=UPI002F92EFDC